MRAEREDMEAMAMIATGPGGQKFIEYLERKQDEKDDECRCRDGHELYRAQGAAQELKNLITLVKTAKDKLN